MTRRGILSFVLFFLATLLAELSYAERPTIGDEMVIVRFDAQLKNAAAEVLKTYPGIRAELMRDLGWQTDFRPEIVLVRERASFREAAESDLVTAFAVPAENLIVIDYSRMNVQPLTLVVTLKHELCHLELHHRIAGQKLPRWLDEGICQWVTGGLAEIISDGGRAILTEAALSNRLMSIGRLGESFPSDGKDLILAYEESRSIVEYIRNEFGSSAVRGTLERMRNGDTLDNAVRGSLRISLDELEKKWRSSLLRKASWLSYIGDNLYGILFAFAALVTVYGFVRFLRKKREYRDEEEDQ